MRLVVDKMAASEYQLTVAQVFQYLQGKLAEAKSATTISADAKDYSVIVMDGGDKALTRDEIKNSALQEKMQKEKKKMYRLWILLNLWIRKALLRLTGRHRPVM